MTNSNGGTQPALMTSRLSIMMFLQFFTWGAWFATMGLALTNGRLSTFIGGAYEAAPIAAIFAPLFLGLIADRFFASEKVFGALMILGGLLMFLVPQFAESASTFATDSYLKFTADGLQGKELADAFAAQQQAENSAGKWMVWLILAHLACYMPTLGLGNTIAFTHIPSQDKFPMIRVWGTIGWIAAGLLIGGMAWDATFFIFTLGAISSVLLGIYCFTLPNTPPPLKGQPFDLGSILMVDAFKLLLNWNFLVFAICSTLICIPLAYYYGSTSQFLGQTGFVAAGATMTLGQMSEIIFMILIPFFFRKLGVKVMILVGMACWVVRYGLFAMGAPDQVTWMLLAAVLLHGICYDFFFVTGFMYTDQKAPREIRGQAQGLLVFLTQGIGMFFGYRIMAQGSLFGIPLNFTVGDYGKTVTRSEEFSGALATARGETEPLGFFETFGKMFSRDLPEGLDADLLSETMLQWQNFWYFPAILAAGVFVIFAVLFWDKTEMPTEEQALDATQEAEAAGLK